MQKVTQKESQTWRLTIAYDGSDFHGWQAQDGLPTVQGALQEALQVIQQEPVFVKGAGRTDAGVHAMGQVASCAFESRLTERKMILALSSLLPREVRVMRAERMPHGFNAKKHSIGKRYAYRILQGDVVSPFLAPYVWHIKANLNLEAMRQGAAQLIGEQDFESFRSVHCDAAHARRYLWRVAVVQEGPEIHIEVRGNAFCRNMVRIIAGTLVDIGRGKISPETMSEIIHKKNRSAAGVTAPSHGLFLQQVYYPDQLDEAEIPQGAVFPNHPHDAEFWPPQPIVG